MGTAKTALSAESDAISARKRIKDIIAASSGNLVEWYDFYAFAFTSIFFASAFFPTGDPTSQLLAAAGIFAVGFFMRPLGGWLFGWLADTRGRRYSMVFSVLLMCAGSLMIAVLPTYQSVGTLAPWLLLVARLLQGLSVGGEYGAAATYMSEVAGRGRRGFYSSFQYVTLIGGQLLALLVLGILQLSLTTDQLKAWGWRIPFAIGAIAAICALYLRLTLDETASAELMQHKDAGSLAALMKYKRALLITFAFTAGGSLYFYSMTTYMQKFLINTLKMGVGTASGIMTAALVVFMLMQPAFGALSDKIGRKSNMLCFGALATVATVPLLSWLAGMTSSYGALALILVGLVIAAFYTSISGVVKAELFPAEIRTLGVGFTYAIANALFGGTAEYVALSFKSGGWEAGFFWYVSAMSLIVLAAALWMPDTRERGYLDGSGQIEAEPASA